MCCCEIMTETMHLAVVACLVLLLPLFLSVKRRRNMPLKKRLIFISAPTLSLLILVGIFSVSESAPNKIPIRILSAAAVFILNGIIYYFSDTSELQRMERQIRDEKENYRHISEKYLEIRRIKHDISNQLAAAQRMFLQGRTDEAVRHIDRLSAQLADAGAVCCTGIPSVDAVVNMKWEHSLSLGIPFSCKVLLADKPAADELLLCRIIANLLDNAIEGAQRSSAEERFVCFSIADNSEKLHISVTNTSDEVDTDNLSTSKKGSSHGIGIGSICDAVRRLDGIHSFSYKDGIFFADVVTAYWDKY